MSCQHTKRFNYSIIAAPILAKQNEAGEIGVEDRRTPRVANRLTSNSWTESVSTDESIQLGGGKMFEEDLRGERYRGRRVLFQNFVRWRPQRLIRFLWPVHQHSRPR